MVANLMRPPGDSLLTAIGYARNCRSSLEVCRQNPDVRMDTIHLSLERCVMPGALGLPNWLFWTEAGAGAVGILQKLVST